MTKDGRHGALTPFAGAGTVQKSQLDAGVAAYTEESGRAEILKKRAEVYLGVTAVYAALVAFVTEEAAPENLLGFVLFEYDFMVLRLADYAVAYA